MYINSHVKYRPTNLNEFVFPDPTIKSDIDSYVVGNQTKPLILYGTYGTGKSLLAELIPKAIDGDSVQVTYVRATALNSERDVFKIFTRPKQFDKIFTPPNQSRNYYIIEEVNFENKAQSAFRTYLDQFEGVDLTIITTNELHEIDAAIRSRANLVGVPPAKPDAFFPRAKEIFELENKPIKDSTLLAALKDTRIGIKGNRAYYETIDKLFQSA